MHSSNVLLAPLQRGVSASPSSCRVYGRVRANLSSENHINPAKSRSGVELRACHGIVVVLFYERA